jgi:hypothetical protein
MVAARPGCTPIGLGLGCSMTGFDSSNRLGATACASVVVFGAAGAAKVMLVGRDLAEGVDEEDSSLKGAASGCVGGADSAGVGVPSRRDRTSTDPIRIMHPDAQVNFQTYQLATLQTSSSPPPC